MYLGVEMTGATATGEEEKVITRFNRNCKGINSQLRWLFFAREIQTKKAEQKRRKRRLLKLMEQKEEVPQTNLADTDMSFKDVKNLLSNGILDKMTTDEETFNRLHNGNRRLD